MRKLRLDNAERGCGRLKKGGCYLVAQASPDGNLASWYWMVGMPYEANGGMIYGEVPPRQMLSIDPAATLAAQEIRRDRVSDGDVGKYVEWGRVALIDHVGAEFYETPVAFARECARRGPSRRVPPAIAKALAGSVPFPIWFTHSRLPWFEGEEVYQHVISVLDLPAKAALPTWDLQGANLMFGGSFVLDHPAVALLKAMDEREDARELVGVAEQTALTEGLFGGSWITDVVYVLQDGEDEPPADLADAGVIAGVIE